VRRALLLSAQAALPHSQPADADLGGGRLRSRPKLLDAYYEFKGWNRDGIPTRQTLHELDLDFVAEDFLERGILQEGEDEPAAAASSE
jgi:hypothetical protein